MVRLITLCSLTLCACSSGPSPRDITTLSVLLSEAPESLDPRRGSSAVEMRVQELIFRGLVRIADDLSMTEDLAERIINEHAQHITIHLKDNIRFHTCFDGTAGGTLKAIDVAYSYLSLRDPAVASRKERILADVSRIDYPDPNGLEVHVHLRRPQANWLAENGSLGIIEKACASKNPEDFARRPSGTGSLAFERREGDRRLWLKSVDPKLAFNTMELRVVSDETSRLLELLKGRADVLTVTPSRPLLAPLKRRHDLELINASGNGYSYLAFNLRLPELKDRRVRQALALAIDRKAIIKHKYLGLARASSAMTPPDHWAHPHDLKASAYNPRQAALLLHQAGWKTNPDLLGHHEDQAGRPTLRLEMRTTPEKFGRALSLVLQDQLRHVGIDLQLRINDWGTLYSQVKKGNFQLVRMEWIPVLSPALLDWVFHSKSQPSQAGACRHVRDCPGHWLKGAEATSDRYSCSAKTCPKTAQGCSEDCVEEGGECLPINPGLCRRNGGNRGGYTNPEVDALLDQASQITHRQDQAELYRQVQRQLARDLPYVSLWHEDRVWIIRHPWTGIRLQPSGSLLSLLAARPKGAP